MGFPTIPIQFAPIRTNSHDRMCSVSPCIDDCNFKLPKPYRDQSLHSKQLFC